jgi:hypothetical protein
MLLSDKSWNNNSLILVIKCEDREEVGTTLHKSRQQYISEKRSIQYTDAVLLQSFRNPTVLLHSVLLDINLN